MSKEELYERGVELVQKFVKKNSLFLVTIDQVDRNHRLATVDACAWYRTSSIHIKVWACATIGRGGRAWSYPGYVIDRTPYGVLAHELGHHVDFTKSGYKTSKRTYGSDYSKTVRKKSKEPKLTNYCPDDFEWFAEMFRLFVTNPMLLKAVRPNTYKLLRADFIPVERRKWETVLQDAPERTVLQARKKIERVQ